MQSRLQQDWEVSLKIVIYNFVKLIKYLHNVSVSKSWITTYFLEKIPAFILRQLEAGTCGHSVNNAHSRENYMKQV